MPKTDARMNDVVARIVESLQTVAPCTGEHDWNGGDWCLDGCTATHLINAAALFPMEALFEKFLSGAFELGLEHEPLDGAEDHDTDCDCEELCMFGFYDTTGRAEAAVAEARQWRKVTMTAVQPTNVKRLLPDDN